MEHIKKGMGESILTVRKRAIIKKNAFLFSDKYRTNNKIMTNFPADVVKAEQLTGGNANILSTLEASTPTKSRTSIVAASTAASPDVSKKTVQTSSPTAAAATKKTAGSYNSSVKVQNTTSSAQKPNEKKLTCTMCSFSTDRMNLLMMHIKNHSLTILSRVNCKCLLHDYHWFSCNCLSLVFAKLLHRQVLKRESQYSREIRRKSQMPTTVLRKMFGRSKSR
jgi:hypothetical protein